MCYDSYIDGIDQRDRNTIRLVISLNILIYLMVELCCQKFNKKCETSEILINCLSFQEIQIIRSEKKTVT